VVPAAAALAVGAAVAAATVTAAAGDTQDPRQLRRARVGVDPPLAAASEAVQARTGRAVMDLVTAESAERGAMWDAIAACETQGNWAARGSAFSGGLGFANGAWSGFGGLEFAPDAGQATREQQIAVAERIRASVGMGAWGCARTLGLTRR
jgi:hypothetical protein